MTGNISYDSANHEHMTRLRAERIEGGEGRNYRLTYRLRDASGNETSAVATVFVPATRAGLDPRRFGIRLEPIEGVTPINLP